MSRHDVMNNLILVALETALDGQEWKLRGSRRDSDLRADTRFRDRKTESVCLSEGSVYC